MAPDQTAAHADHVDPTDGAPLATSPTTDGRRARGRSPRATVVFDVQDLSVYYGAFRAVRDVNLQIHQHEITAFIGPSGCGKSTVLRCFDRMNDLIEGARVEGKVAVPRRRPLRPDASTPSRCASASAWSSRSPTRSPSRSTTTSPSVPGSPGSRASSTTASRRPCAGPRCGTR